jgi:hypothetical protein
MRKDQGCDVDVALIADVSYERRFGNALEATLRLPHAGQAYMR